MTSANPARRHPLPTTMTTLSARPLAVRRRITDLPPEDKPREKLLRAGPRLLSDAELIAILLGSGSTTRSAIDLAYDLLDSVNGDLDAMARLGPDNYQRLNGIGEAKTVRLLASFELGRRRRDQLPRTPPLLNDAESCFRFLRRHLADLSHESFHLLCLNRASRLVHHTQISSGGTTSTVVDAKLLFKAALAYPTVTSIVLAHNHPSGQAFPSPADVALTRKLSRGAQLLDLAVLDHLIVAGRKYYSFAEEGFFAETGEVPP